MGDARTVKVRIAVAVDRYERWAVGSSSYLAEVDEFDSSTLLAELTGDAVNSVVWVEVDIPVPGRAPTIQATVTKAEDGE